MSSSAKKLLYVFEVGPYSTSAGAEALESVLIGASLEQDLSLLFIHDGIFQLKDQQATVASQSKYTKTFKALNDFDVDKVFVHDLSMVARGLEPNDLIIQVALVTSAEVAELISLQDRVFTF